ncbi:MAG: UvrB/UvrC motif-containing protein [Isosphaeraceae bacterium]
MSQDLRPLIAGWDFNPDELQVRVITGDDGTEKIQVRVDLGILQVELSGRPDGQRPHGQESLLDYFEARKGQAEAGEDFTLEHSDCVLLMQEGLQYYRRYLSAFQLGRFELVVRDTERNLRLFRFVVEHAARQRDKIEFDQYRPYVTMMRTRARALMKLDLGDHTAALAEIDQGLEQIREFLRDYQQADDEGQCSELRFLLRWRKEVEQDRPTGPIERLEQQLALSIALEDFEEAARLRDQIKLLKDIPTEHSRRV